jgi:hypothetical protein
MCLRRAPEVHLANAPLSKDDHCSSICLRLTREPGAEARPARFYRIMGTIRARFMAAVSAHAPDP